MRKSVAPRYGFDKGAKRESSSPEMPAPQPETPIPWGSAAEWELEAALLAGFGLSQRDIAEKLRCSQQLISKCVVKNPEFYGHIRRLVQLCQRESDVHLKEDWKERLVERHAMLADKSLALVAKAIDDGDLPTAKETLREIMNRNIGVPSRKVEISGRISGEIQHSHHLYPAEDMRSFAQLYAQQQQLLLGEVADAVEAEVVADDGG